MTNTEINDIVAAAKRGEDGATAKLYKATIEQALSYAMLCLMLNEHDAQDIVSESYLAAFSKLEQYETGTNFTAWLFKIIKNKAIDRKRKLKTAQDYERLVEVLQADNSADSFTQAERDTALQNIIDTLPEKQREAVRLHYIDGLTVREVAERLGISENTAKTHIRRGFQSIKAAVLDNGNRDTWLGGFAALPLFRSMLKEDIKSGFYTLSAQSGAAVTATGTAAVAAIKLGLGGVLMGMGTGAKIGIATAFAVILAGGISVPMYIHAESAREQEAAQAAVIQQQEAEAQAAERAAASEAARESARIAELGRQAAQDAADRAEEADRLAAEQEREQAAAATSEFERIAQSHAAQQAVASSSHQADAQNPTASQVEKAGASQAASQAQQTGGASGASKAASSQVTNAGQIPGRNGQTGTKVGDGLGTGKLS